MHICTTFDYYAYSMELLRHVYYASVDFNMQKDKTPLHHTAEEGSKECMKLLVHEYSADPEEVDMVCR